MAEQDVLTRESLLNLIELIQGIYKSDGRPWVIGYSGGKDSSAVLQLVWVAISKLPENERHKKVFVISSDTMVEAPSVVNRIAISHEQIKLAAKDQKMPFVAHMVRPKVTDTFWVNIIGRGYPTPYSNFRWCTDRMKIQPTTKFITDTVAQYGEVVILLGARRQESNTRAQVMERRKDIGNRLSRHNDLPNAFVFTPIEDWSQNDVWTYLLGSKNPWGGDNKDLKTMYLNAQSGECPLVIDKSTPSCGGGRFGCWTCTVVSKDKSMENLIDNGEDWMQPMSDFRNSLADIERYLSNRPSFKKKLSKFNDERRQYFQNPDAPEDKRLLLPEIIAQLKIDDDLEVKDITGKDKKRILEIICKFDSRFVYRDLKRRNGRIELFKTKEDGVTVAKVTWGPYKLETKKEILKGLFEKQKEIRELAAAHPSKTPEKIDLITDEELHQIRKMWRFEEGDWEDSLPTIYKEVFGEDFEGLTDDTSGLGGAEQKILSEISNKYEIPERMFMELFEVERNHQGMGRRAGIYNKLGSVLRKDWRNFEESEIDMIEEPVNADQ